MTALRFTDFRGVGDHGLGVEFNPDPDQVLADAHVGHGVIVELVRAKDSETWEVWAVRIDGVLYFEPRNMEGETLQPGPFADEVNVAERDGRQFLD